MSVLNGNISREAVFATDLPFGEHLKPHKGISSPAAALKGCMDIAYDPGRGLLIAACAGSLELFRVSNKGDTPGSIEKLSSLGGIGASRQLAFGRGGYAFVTARHDGIYIADLRDEQNPRLIGHLDSLELATGIALYEGGEHPPLLCVTNRHMGNELWDVSDPHLPHFLGSYLAGESQSAAFFTLPGDERLFTASGDWMNKRVQIHDVTDPKNVRLVSMYNVDGFADGCAVVRQGGRTLCLTSTGHHAARFRNRWKYQKSGMLLPCMLEEGYGCGHGLEIFEISEPVCPEYLGSVKFPPHHGGIDSWRVSVSGDCALCCDSAGGFFAVDIKNPAAPEIACHFLPAADKNQPVSPPPVQTLRMPVMGALYAAGSVWLAYPGEGLYALDPSALEARMREPEIPAADSAQTAGISHIEKADKQQTAGGIVFSCSSQVHSFAVIKSEGGERLIFACGNSGLAVCYTEGGEITRRLTPAPCHDVIAIGDSLEDQRIFAAEGSAGVAEYRYHLGALTEIERIDLPGARELVYLPTQKVISVQVGVGSAGLIALDGGKFDLLGTYPVGGMLYHRHFVREPFDGHLVTLPLGNGPKLFEVSAEDGGTVKPVHIAFTDRQLCPIEEGAAAGKGHLYAVLDGRLAVYSSPNEFESLGESAAHTLPGVKLRGIPFVCGDSLVVLNRCTGEAVILDISEPSSPKFAAKRLLPGHPEYAAALPCGSVLVCCGHTGAMLL